MRKSTKTLIALIGTAVVALGVVVNFTSASEVQAARPRSYDTHEAIEEVIEIPAEVQEVWTPGPSPEEIQQERITAQAAADREALVAEGLKYENHYVKGADGYTHGSGLIGLYFLDDIKGIAYSPVTEDRTTCYGIAYETDSTKSPAAIATANEVAQSVNAVVGPSINFQYGKVVGDQISQSSEGVEGTMMMGLDPTFAGEGDRVAVIAIYPGGETKILEDTDDDPTTVSVNVPATDSSLVMYSIIKYN